MKELSQILKLCKKGDRIAQQNLYQKKYTELAVAQALFEINPPTGGWVEKKAECKAINNIFLNNFAYK